MKTWIDEQALHRCGQLLNTQGWTLVCAESMTAGFLSSICAMEVNSGDYFLGSIVCYDDRVKRDLLQVPAAKLEKYCSESAVATLRLLDGLRTLVPQATVHVSITGLAYKTSNPKQKRPVGTVYYAIAFQDHKVIFKKKFEGEAADILILACNSLIDDLYQWLGRLQCMKMA